MWYRQILSIVSVVSPYVIFGSVFFMGFYRLLIFLESRKNTASKKIRSRK